MPDLVLRLAEAGFLVELCYRNGNCPGCHQGYYSLVVAPTLDLRPLRDPDNHGDSGRANLDRFTTANAPYDVWRIAMKSGCPSCGGPLEMAAFVESWYKNGKPRRTEKDPVCRRCGVRWADFDLAAEEEVQHN